MLYFYIPGEVTLYWIGLAMIGIGAGAVCIVLNDWLGGHQLQHGLSARRRRRSIKLELTIVLWGLVLIGGGLLPA